MENGFENGESQSKIEKLYGIHHEEEICEKFNSLDLVEIPSVIFKRRNLRDLYLDYNNITTLPAELCVQCCHLKILSIVGNDVLKLPANLGHLKLLEELYINENKLTDLPESLTDCYHLKIINFVGNTISRLPHKIQKWTHLANIYGDENALNELPPSFGSLCDLQVAEFSGNEIKELPENFGCLTKLRILNLSSNKLQCLPQSFSDLSSIEELDLSSNSLTQLPNTFKSTHCLKKFYCETNEMEALPSWVNHLPGLEEFSLKDNQLRGKPLEDSFGEVSTKLHLLELAGNFISDLPATIGNLKQLDHVELGSVIGELERRNFQNGNWLWKVPKSFAKLVNLRELCIDENQLCELPCDFGDLVNLETLDLGQNRLSDLPESFGHLRSLRVCQLSKNFLEILPSNFGDLVKLQDLRLDNNSLAELPESFSSLLHLKTLDLFNNKLEEVPECLPKLGNLVRLDISENKFGMHHMRVPQVVIQNKYSPRDPSLKDNWRGRPRQDILQVDITTVDVPDEEYGNIPEEPETEDTTMNSRAFESVMRNSLSLWKSHTDTSSKREKFVHPKLYNEMISLQQTVSSSCVNNASENNQEETEPDESGVMRSGSVSPDYVTYEVGECEEDWDKECELSNNLNNPYDLLPQPKADAGMMLGFKPTHSSNSHFFVPSEGHVLNHVHLPVPNADIVEDGQFDDAE